MGETESINGDAASSLTRDIITAIRSSDNGKSMDLKILRATVLTTDIDKSSKKLFKSAIKLLEKDEKISLSSDGVVKLSKSERRSSSTSADQNDEKKDKQRSKRKSKESEADHDQIDENEYKSKKKNKLSAEEDDKVHTDDSQQHNHDDDTEHNGEEDNGEGDTTDPKHKNKPCKNNPQGITRLFLGNLPFAISEPTLNTHLEECITHVKWITDKATGKFYGSAFVEVRNSNDAAKAVTKMNGTMLMGRPIKINFAPVRPGEENDWPPRSRVITGGKLANAGGGGSSGGGGGQAGGSGIKAMSAKPDGCCKLFIGNLSYDIDDEGITKFFMGVEAEIKAVRWLYHQDSGDFKGW